MTWGTAAGPIQPEPKRPTWSYVDLTASLLLVAAHCVAGLATFIHATATFMGTANCFGERVCGSGKWVDAAMITSLVGSIVLIIVSVAVVVVLWSRHRIVVWVPVVALVLQFCLAITVVAMGGQAGPID